MSEIRASATEHHLYVLAHQDDEYGALPWMEDALRSGARISVVYLTDGGSRVAPEVRDAESRAVLLRLGISDEDIHMLSDGTRIPDNRLAANAMRGYGLVRAWMEAHPGVTAIYAPAWEGGHPDHDTAHAIAATLAAQHKLLKTSWQFALYNGYRCPGKLFRVLRQLPTSAEIRSRKHRGSDGFRYAISCRAYPSQWKTWLGLFPEAFVRRAILRREALVRMDDTRFRQRPHTGILLYERMFGTEYSDLSRLISPLYAITTGGSK